MKAMILAAGLGTRLRPLTNERPKALVEVAGRTMLDRTLARLRAFAINDVIINIHHHAEMIADYLASHQNFGMHIEVSREEVLLDTGGGLKHAAWFFLEGADLDVPFVLHNVDILSTIDLAAMLRYHKERNALATLATQGRETSRYLLFDEKGQLCGRQSGPLSGTVPDLVREAVDPTPRAFAGIHILSSRIFAKMREVGPFSIISAYMHLAAVGERIVGFDADLYQWRDLGTAASIDEAAREFESGAYSHWTG